MPPVRFPAFSRLMTVLVVIIAVLLLADVAVAVQLAVRHGFAPAANSSQSSAQSATHPCNHGFYVSQAAHAKKGGGYVSGIAQSSLGKDGKCTAPLPAAARLPDPSSTSRSPSLYSDLALSRREC